MVPLMPGPFDAKNMVLVNSRLLNFTEFKFNGEVRLRVFFID